jgi:chemotaxis protein methyltransferase CheR
MQEVGAPDVAAYAAHLEAHPDEWSALDALCRIPISRVYRDGAVYEAIAKRILPELARRASTEGRAVRAWSAGCASGEEPASLRLAYSFATASDPTLAAVPFALLATDVDPAMLERARVAVYTEGSLREVPDEWRARAFEPSPRGSNRFALRAEFRGGVTYAREDLRVGAADGPFDLVLCRNVAFTYFDEALQRAVAERFAVRLVTDGYLVVGKGEALPAGMNGFEAVAPCVWRRVARAG